ncbi:MAG: DoxX family protein [Myxococcaceae bacterium]|nr:DoxX family protein [Myxococcaceae bacterium]
MEAALSPSAVITPARPRGLVIAYWAFTVLFCLQIGFTAYAQLSLPQLEEVFRHVGMPSWFRVELAWAKFLGIAVLLLPAPARLKEWAHAGFVITLVSAIIAHIASNEGPEVWSWAAGTLVLWALSYFFWRKTERR